MDIISSSNVLQLTPNLCVRKGMSAFLRPKLFLFTGEARAGYTTLLALLTSKHFQFPVVTKLSEKHGTLSYRFHLVRYTDDPGGSTRLTCLLDITMPDRESHLLWAPWLPHQRQPQRDPGIFHLIHPNVVRPNVQPRKTRCYGHAYPYSGTVHPVEEETPAEITALYAESNALFGLSMASRFNMCLENDYGNGRHYISEHSDDERVFGQLHDVCCWVTGPASRTAVFRQVRTADGPHKTPTQRLVLRISLPAGLYVMRGRKFQTRYSHEFPQLYKVLFDKIRTACKSDPHFTDYPTEVPKTKEGIDQTSLVQAAWVWEHRDKIQHRLRDGSLLANGKPARDVARFKEWCLWRTSYTLRNFVVDKEGGGGGDGMEGPNKRQKKSK